MVTVFAESIKQNKSLKVVASGRASFSTANAKQGESPMRPSESAERHSFTE
ncbi:hypothetical protein M427DRAFT_384708 [Gonapodya prolifera JEL478]|uniref:Uncharacterized protein n=1 Tax=Gonapodya prolifera (strain JEL478) TaxID=1344416 RepID=A0A139A8A6_GONPJ|nr:hypothetical protein M427DRAFT_384704 [Gonapodya prolifera JEL478]KXS13041.1 hypothetical protein M427DRAFT_384708 [Gonapodya prolifera JEL478]|eukprot:KXS13040.1 hypothetical protein M427DRAFT_384704 [Gonapodya prolifera JEL478]